MPRAKLRLTVPEGVWVGDLSRRHGGTQFRILAALADEGTGVGLAEVTSESLDAVLSEMRGTEDVVTVDVLQRRETTALVQFETTDPVLLFPVQDSGVPLEMPFDIVGGEAVWEITAPRERLSALGEQLSQFGISFNVEEIRQRIEESQLLTDKQADLVAAAVERGYYDTPRTCSLTELAEELGMAKSTCSETLHRAEGKIIKQFVGERR
jgi:predicted DNA binding protein